MSVTLELQSPPEDAAPDVPSPAARDRSWLCAETAVFLAVWLLLMVVGRQKLFQDPGTFWHTAVGEQMLTTGEFVQRDSFTFTFAGQPWIAQWWLGECLMAAGYRLGGWDTLLLATATLLAGLYAWIAHRWRMTGVSPLGVALILAIVFGASAHHYHARPHVGSMVLLALCYGILCDVESGRARLTRLAWLVPLFALWTNLHGATLGGLATVALVIAGWTAARLGKLPSPLATWPEAALALAVLFACGAAMFINPYGAQMPRAWLTIMQLSLPHMIQEHRRLDFAQPEAWMVLLLGLGYAVALWRSGSWRTWRVTWIIPLVWLCLAFDRVRHAPLFAVVVAVAGAELWRRSQQAAPALPRRALAVPAVLLALCLALQTAGLRVPIVGAQWARHDPSIWPVDLLPELRRLESQSGPTRIFNALHFGGFLVFHTPGLKAFIDDRCELFGEEWLREYALAEAAQPQRLDAWQQAYGFQHALVRAGTPFDRHLTSHPQWVLVRRTRAAALYQWHGRLSAVQ